MIKSKRLSLQATNSLAKKATFVCSLLMSVKDGQVAEPLPLHCGTEPGFNLRAAETDNRSSAGCLPRFSRRSLQTVMFVRVYSIWYLSFLLFHRELEQKADFVNKAFRNAY